MEMNRFSHWYIFVCSAIIIYGCLFYAYSLAIDGVITNIPLKFETNKVQTDKEYYNVGDPVMVNWEYCKGTDTPGEINLTLTDGLVYYLPTIYSTRGKGCYNNYSVIAKIPDAIPQGEYYLSAVLTYKVNSIKTMQYNLTSNKFYIK